MKDKSTFDLIVICWITLACLIFPILLFVTAPYGRHSTRKWGVTISNRVGWILMEIAALLVFLYFIATGNSYKNVVVWILVSLFTLHYINRSLIYPLRINTKAKRIPLLIVIMAIVFNTVNGYINGYYIGTVQHQYGNAWLTDPRFIAGILLFFTGMIINIAADERLIHLRKGKTDGYQVPYGGLFNIISCPNFFGEIIEWLGFAIMCWSLPAISFLAWTICNLVPRALDHHRWYKKQFADYPANRKAVIPLLL
jgi:3-oxo-5-alpha-steroid 4-dehydrogenase 1